MQRVRDSQKGDIVRLGIEDNGKGFGPTAPHNSFGLPGMRERVLAVGGDFSVMSSRHKGVQILAKFFINPAGE